MREQAFFKIADRETLSSSTHPAGNFDTMDRV